MSLIKEGAGNPANDGNDFYSLEAIYDFSVTSATANAVIEMLQIPANTFVSGVVVEVMTVDSGNTFDVGDGDDIDGYHDAIDATSAVVTMSTLLLTEGAPNTVTGYRAGKTYLAADSIDVKVLGQTFAAAKVRVKAFCQRLG